MTDKADTQATDTQIPKIALWLGLGGLIPFVFFTYVAVLGLNLFGYPLDPFFGVIALLSYAAVILSFLGGVRWGMAMNRPCRKQSILFALAIVPCLVGWVSANFLPFPIGLPLLIVAFVAHGIWDVMAVKRNAGPQWYAKLRIILTIGACLCLVVALVGLSIFETEALDLPDLSAEPELEELLNQN